MTYEDLEILIDAYADKVWKVQQELNELYERENERNHTGRALDTDHFDRIEALQAKERQLSDHLERLEEQKRKQGFQDKWQGIYDRDELDLH